jgi:hypothetical protein
MWMGPGGKSSLGPVRGVLTHVSGASGLLF